MPDDSKFCHNCGTSVTEEESAAVENVTYGDVIDDDVIRLIGEKNTQYYVKNFNNLKQLNKKTSWNWPAFLVTPAWLFYRKMYIHGIIVMAFNTLVSQYLSLVLSLAVSAAIGVFANYVYMDYLEGLALEAKNLTGTAKDDFIRTKGGTSIIAVLVSFAFSMAISAVAGIIF